VGLLFKTLPRDPEFCVELDASQTIVGGRKNLSFARLQPRNRKHASPGAKDVADVLGGKVIHGYEGDPATSLMTRRNPRNSTSQLTTSSVSEFSTKQLSNRTWSDFERLFETHPAPGAHPCWCMYNHREGVEKKTSRAIWIKR